jgi:hypothetical protein
MCAIVRCALTNLLNRSQRRFAVQLQNEELSASAFLFYR